MYAEFDDEKCEGAMIAFKDFFSYLIRCEDCDISKINYRRSARSWKYVDSDGEVKHLPNPIKKHKHDSNIIHYNMMEDIESDIYSKFGVFTPPVYGFTILRGNIRSFEKEDVYTEEPSSKGRLLAEIESKSDYFVNRYITDTVTEWYRAHQRIG